MKKALRFLLLFLMGAASGLIIIVFANGDSSSPVHFIEFLVSLAITAYLQIILHEAGHLVCGLYHATQGWQRQAALQAFQTCRHRRTMPDVTTPECASRPDSHEAL